MKPLQRLWRGEMSLATTYWVFGFLLGGVGSRLLWSLIEQNSIRLIRTGHFAFIFYSFVAVSVGYSLFIAVATWRSANRYSGPRRWRVLAQFAVVVSMVVTVGVVIREINSKELDEYSVETLQQVTETLNKSLPSKVDEITELTRVSAKEQTLTYHMRIIGKTAGDIDMSRLSSHVTKQSCDSKEIREMVANGITVTYAYTDSANTPIGQVKITRRECNM